MKSIGVLALQGGFDPHVRTLKKLSVETKLVKSWEEICAVDALVIPGGESTTIGKLLVLRNLLEPLQKLIQDGFPVFGTCAGLILLSKRANGHEQPLLGSLDIDVARNAYGRQIESFEVNLPFSGHGKVHDVPAVFIRAPQISRMGKEVSVLAEYENLPVCVRQRKILGAAFHPELTDSTEIHEYFLEMI